MVFDKGCPMNKILYTILTIFIFTEVSFAAMSGGSSSASSSSSTSYSSSSSGDSGAYSSTNRFKDITKLIKLDKFAEAHKMLKNLKQISTDEADRLNLLGFTARKSGDLAAAGNFYQRALSLNPKHIGALEYQGELFIQLGKLDLAQENLEKINKICWLPCNAERELKKAIEKSMTN
jgi:tetratricopeptide (TPR) repeat protein